MKKGYYICMISDNASSGVIKKIEVQVAELKKRFSIDLIKVSKRQRGMFKRLWGLFFWVSNLYDYEQLFGKLVDPDFLYIRYPLTDRKMLLFLQRVKKTYPACKIIIEIPTYPYDGEKWYSTDFPFLIKDIYYRKQLKQYTDRLVTYSVNEMIWDIPTIRTINGVDVGGMKTIQPKIHPKDEIHMIGVAMLQKRHGFERMIAGLKQYYENEEKTGLRKIFFHIVGNGAEKNKYEKCAQEYSLSEHVIFHGTLAGEKLDDIYNQCDLAVAALGLYKINMDHISTIKTGEYLAKGLPIIYAAQEGALSQSYPYCMEVPNDDRPIDIKSIICFYDKIYGDSYDKRLESIKYIRSYAERTVDMNKVMKPIVQYIEG